MDVSEHRFLNVARNYGGWPKVLDPDFVPPKDFYFELEAAGYTREDFKKLCAKKGKPEREAWLEYIAVCLYCEWRNKLRPLPRDLFMRLAPGFDNGIRWRDINAFLTPSSVNFAPI